MTSKLKCPACSVELSETNDGFFMFCRNNACPDCNKLLLGTKELWQALIQAKQDLEQSEKCCSAWETQALDYKAETIALSGKLEIATKALKDIASGQIIEHSVFGHECDNKIAVARNALEQIEHKE